MKKLILLAAMGSCCAQASDVYLSANHQSGPSTGQDGLNNVSVGVHNTLTPKIDFDVSMSRVITQGDALPQNLNYLFRAEMKYNFWHF